MGGTTLNLYGTKCLPFHQICMNVPISKTFCLGRPPLDSILDQAQVPGLLHLHCWKQCSLDCKQEQHLKCAKTRHYLQKMHRNGMSKSIHKMNNIKWSNILYILAGSLPKLHICLVCMHATLNKPKHLVFKQQNLFSWWCLLALNLYKNNIHNVQKLYTAKTLGLL